MLFLLLDLIVRNLVWSDESERPSLTTASQISLVRGAWNSFPGCSYSKHHTAHTSFSVTYPSSNATTNQECMYSIIKAACQTCATYNYVHVQGLVLPSSSSSSSFMPLLLSSSSSSSLSLFPDHCGSCSSLTWSLDRNTPTASHLCLPRHPQLRVGMRLEDHLSQLSPWTFTSWPCIWPI